MLMTNVTGRTLNVRAELLVGASGSDLIPVSPDASVECKEGYCHPRRAPNGSRIPSVVERVAPGLEPADEDFRATWKQVPETNWSAPPRKPTTSELIAQGISPGVAAILEKKAALAEPTPAPSAPSAPAETATSDDAVEADTSPGKTIGKRRRRGN